MKSFPTLPVATLSTRPPFWMCTWGIVPEQRPLWWCSFQSSWRARWPWKCTESQSVGLNFSKWASRIRWNRTWRLDFRHWRRQWAIRQRTSCPTSLTKWLHRQHPHGDSLADFLQQWTWKRRAVVKWQSICCPKGVKIRLFYSNKYIFSPCSRYWRRQSKRGRLKWQA